MTWRRSIKKETTRPSDVFFLVMPLIQHVEPTGLFQSIRDALTAAEMLLSEISKVKLGNIDCAINSRISSCSWMNGLKSLYRKGLPEIFNLSSLAASKLSGDLIQNMIRKFKGRSVSSSQRKS